MDEELKQRALISVWIFSIVVIIYQVLFNSSVGVFSYGKMTMGAVLGLMAGGIVFGVLSAMKK